MNTLFPKLIILFLGMSAFAQSEAKDLRLVDSFNDLNCESLLARLDNIAVQAYQSPESRAYLVLHPGGDPIQNHFYERYLRLYVVNRKFDPYRLMVVTTDKRSKLSFEFWISKPGTTTPTLVSKPLDPKLSLDPGSYRFVTATVEVTHSEGKYVYFGACSACCIETVNLEVLSEFLNENKAFTARISIYARSRLTAKRLARDLRAEASTKYSIPSSDIKIVYKGVEKGIAQLPRNYATVIIDLISPS